MFIVTEELYVEETSPKLNFHKGKAENSSTVVIPNHIIQVC